MRRLIFDFFFLWSNQALIRPISVGYFQFARYDFIWITSSCSMTCFLSLLIPYLFLPCYTETRNVCLYLNNRTFKIKCFFLALTWVGSFTGIHKYTNNKINDGNIVYTFRFVSLIFFLLALLSGFSFNTDNFRKFLSKKTSMPVNTFTASTGITHKHHTTEFKAKNLTNGE